jgi:hypothetical protein
MACFFAIPATKWPISTVFDRFLMVWRFGFLGNIFSDFFAKQNNWQPCPGVLRPQLNPAILKMGAPGGIFSEYFEKWGGFSSYLGGWFFKLAPRTHFQNFRV